MNSAEDQKTPKGTGRPNSRAASAALARRNAGSVGRVRIFTHQDAREVDGVIDALRAAGAEVERHNLCQFPGQETITLAAGDEQNVKASRGVHPAGWVHDLGLFSFEPKLTGLAREVALGECHAFVEGLLLRQSCVWLNTPDALRLASNKPYQLHLAERLGIPTPDYLVTNDPGELDRFARRHHGRVVVKTLDTAFVRYGQRTLKFYTRRLADVEATVREGLRFAPIICQREICRQSEIRVTVVDNACYSVAVDCTHLPDGVSDVRQLNYEKERNRFSTPRPIESVESWSKQIVRALGLNYAGLDWAITTKGDPVLFEVNACGSFKWFELVGAGDITTAIALALLHRTSRRGNKR